MKPPDNTGGYPAAATHPTRKTVRPASMKPPDNTGGYRIGMIAEDLEDAGPQ